jgi:hypothetical protein
VEKKSNHRIMPEQLRLFPPARPLLNRFGAEFFRSLPRTPGVYLMHDSAGRLIYVGKAKSLRDRVSSYKYVSPETGSRKLIRLVHAVERITWEICESDLAAQLRENFLLRTHRPKFNAVNVFPKAYCFFGTKVVDRRLEVCLVREELPDVRLFGAFKSGSLPYGALLRTLWILTTEQLALHKFPNGFLSGTAPGNFAFPEMSDSEVRDDVHSFLDGEHANLLGRLDAMRARWPQALSLFETQFLEADRQMLADFFERVTRRSRLLRQDFKIEGPIIPQELLNDLLVQARFVLREPGGKLE